MINKKFESEEYKYLVEILTHMCEMVGADVNQIDFLADGWQHNYTWTQEQEKEFKEWFVTYMYRKPQRQRGIYEVRGSWHTPKKELRKWANMFNFQYGWRTETDKERRKRLRLERINTIEEEL